MLTPPKRATPLQRGLAAAVLIGLILTGLALSVRWSQTRREAAPPVPAAEAPPPSAAPPAAPLPPPALDRAGLIAAARAAASAWAAGQPAPAAEAELIGRRFDLRIPFGCRGPASGPDAPALRFEQKAPGRPVRISARPQEWAGTPLAQALAPAGGFEAVEGFWIPRPWTDSEACPPPAPPAPEAGTAAGEAAAAPASPQTLGLAVFLTPDSPRTARRGGRPYEQVVKADEAGAPPFPQGLRLALSGRIAGLDDRRAFVCASPSPDRRPVCLAAVEFDRVAFEDPATGKTLAEWRD